jgi:hypothetical protein
MKNATKVAGDTSWLTRLKDMLVGRRRANSGITLAPRSTHEAFELGRCSHHDFSANPYPPDTILYKAFEDGKSTAFWDGQI